MFTGIIENTTTIERLEQGALQVRCPWNTDEIVLGQSIAIDGCCLTVTSIQNGSLTFHLSPETLAKTIFHSKKTGDAVNLERALKFGDRLDGHLVTGHVDAVVKLLASETHADGVSKKMTLEVLPAFQAWLAPKGSVTLDGVSLTVNDVADGLVLVTLVPHTLANTIMQHYRIGSRVNVEVDLVARYVERLLGNA